MLLIINEMPHTTQIYIHFVCFIIIFIKLLLGILWIWQKNFPECSNLPLKVQLEQFTRWKTLVICSCCNFNSSYCGQFNSNSNSWIEMQAILPNPNALSAEIQEERTENGNISLTYYQIYYLCNQVLVVQC